MTCDKNLPDESVGHNHPTCELEARSVVSGFLERIQPATPVFGAVMAAIGINRWRSGDSIAPVNAIHFRRPIDWRGGPNIPNPAAGVPHFEASLDSLEPRRYKADMALARFRFGDWRFIPLGI